MVKGLGLFLCVMTMALHGEAKVNVNKKKDTPLSTGQYTEDLYLCNVGISHPRPAPLPPQGCNGGDCESEVITDPAKGSDTLFLELSDMHDNTLGTDYVRAERTGKSSYSSSQTQWGNNITDLTLNLASEHYGATYNLDFCYLGPVYETESKGGSCDKGLHKDNGHCYGQYKNPNQANDPQSVGGQNPGNGNGPGGNGNGNGSNNGNNGNGNNGNGNGNGSSVDLSLGRYSIQTLLAATNAQYVQNAQLMVRSYYVCTYRNNGGPRELSEVAEPNLVLSGSATPFAPFSISQALLYRSQLNSNPNDVPRFCLIRFEFKETSQAPRKNQGDQVEFTIGIDILKEAIESSWPGMNLP